MGRENDAGMLARIFFSGMVLVMGFPASLSAAEPAAIINGLAVYRVGDGAPVFLMPYPHASSQVPMAESELATLLVQMGRSVISFDAPGSFRSHRPAEVTMEEMVACTLETLSYFRITGPIDVAGHSMSSFCALAFAIEHQHDVKKLVLIGSTSGWPAVRKWSIQQQLKKDRRVYRKFMWLGFRLFAGLGNLAVHKQLDHIIAQASYVDKSYVPDIEIEKQDRRRPVPVRAAWPGYLRRSNVDYKDRLHELNIPVLICVGEYDPQTPVVMSEELHAGIRNSELVLFGKSGHSPFIEESARFVQVVRRFLSPVPG